MLVLILGPNLGIRVWKLKEEAVFSEKWRLDGLCG
jgi:hypothetical protein